VVLLRYAGASSALVHQLLGSVDSVDVCVRVYTESASSQSIKHPKLSVSLTIKQQALPLLLQHPAALASIQHVSSHPGSCSGFSSFLF
jgi:hypothetical protein